jgi:uncharacterized membrane protein YeaQ/YmgE (transglycosylase-associated protein family)
MDIVGALTSLIGGAVGGNAIGASWKEASLGTLGNTIAGVIGGVAGDYILRAVGVLNSLGLADMSVSAIATQAGAAAVGGAVLTAIVGLIKNKMAK